MDISHKIQLKNILRPFDDDNEGTVMDDRGTLVQIIDGQMPFTHLVYLDLQTKDFTTYRGSHYHEKKIEVFYIISGLVEAQFYDLDTKWEGHLTLTPGLKLTLFPRLAHRFRAIEYSQMIEISPLPYDRSDVFPFDFSTLDNH